MTESYFIHILAMCAPIYNKRAVLKPWLEYFLAVTVFALAIFASVYGYSILKDAENKGSDTVFFDRSFDRAAVLQWEMERVLGDLNLVTSYLSLANDWKEDYFRGNFKNLTAVILDRSPSCQSIQFAPVVTEASERAFLENQAAQQLDLVTTSAPSQANSPPNHL